MNITRQVIYLTYFHMRSRYRKTFAGFLWVIASPILTFLVQSLIFKEIFRFHIDNYPLFLLSGLLPWFFISQTLSSTTSCLVLSREVLLAFKIRPIVILSSQVLDQFISFFAAFFIMGVYLVLPEIDKYSILRLFSLLINFVGLFYFVLIATMILSFWHVFYRDVNFVTQFLMGLAFYVTPIFYTPNIFPEKFSWILNYNLFIPFVKIFQNSLYQWDFANWAATFQVIVCINIILTMIAYLSFKFKMRDFYINV